MTDWWIAYAQVWMMFILCFSGCLYCCRRFIPLIINDVCWEIIEKIYLSAYGTLHFASLFTAVNAQIRINQLKSEPYELAYAVKLENTTTIVRLCLVTIFLFSWFMPE